jgi:hypothetical protein
MLPRWIRHVTAGHKRKRAIFKLKEALTPSVLVTPICFTGFLQERKLAFSPITVETYQILQKCQAGVKLTPNPHFFSRGLAHNIYLKRFNYQLFLVAILATT